MKLPTLTPELVWKLDNMQTILDLDRLGGMARVEGNPWRIEIKRFGRATAFSSSVLSADYYNKVFGLGMAEVNFLPQLALFYQRSGVTSCRIDVLPGDLDLPLADRLTAYGLRHVDFQAGFYGLPTCGDQPAPQGVVVRDVESDDDLTSFLEICHTGWDLNPGTLEAFTQVMRFWRELPGWHLYLACIDDAPRGAGVMFDKDGIGYLALATTLPEFRGRGAEQALIRRAIVNAGQVGCELICGQCDFPSATARNLQRYGMELAYTKAKWVLTAQSGPLYRDGEASLY